MHWHRGAMYQRQVDMRCAGQPIMNRVMKSDHRPVVKGTDDFLAFGLAWRKIEALTTEDTETTESDLEELQLGRGGRVVRRLDWHRGAQTGTGGHIPWPAGVDLVY
jgi:hypothetical protein